jgi:hypothetical protein
MDYRTAALERVVYLIGRLLRQEEGKGKGKGNSKEIDMVVIAADGRKWTGEENPGFWDVWQEASLSDVSEYILPLFE